jgi:hypothetical protein
MENISAAPPPLLSSSPEGEEKAPVQLGYPHGIYQYIYNLALVLHPSHIFSAFHYGRPECGLMGLALYATSLNYWRYPRIGSWRRVVDMAVAKSTIAYHLYLSLSTSNRWLTTMPISFGSSLYFVSLFLHGRGHNELAAGCHCLLHLLVSFGATMTYRDLSLHPMWLVQDSPPLPQQ